MHSCRFVYLDQHIQKSSAGSLTVVSSLRCAECDTAVRENVESRLGFSYSATVYDLTKVEKKEEPEVKY